MKARIISGLVLVAVTLALLLFAPTTATLAVFAVILLICAWEWSGFLRASGVGERLAFVVVVAFALAAAWMLSADPRWLRAVLWIAAAWWLAALFWVLRGPQTMNRAGAWIAGVLVLVPAAVAIGRIRADLPDGEQWTIFVLTLVGVADTGAFFAGRAFGRRRLAPLVSPGKTWEGVAGGMALAALCAAVASLWFEVPSGPMILAGVVVAAFSVVGDLIESLLKRYAGVKDSGALIPGHGGLMDRLDSVMAAGPLLLLCLLEVLPVAWQ